MDRQRIAKHMIESSEMAFNDMMNAMTSSQSDAEKLFFSFVDKNPLFENNSLESVNKYLLASRKKRHIAKTPDDESCEYLSEYLSGADHPQKG